MLEEGSEETGSREMDWSSACKQYCGRTDVCLTNRNFGMIGCANEKTILLARITKIAEEIVWSLVLESLVVYIHLIDSRMPN